VPDDLLCPSASADAPDAMVIGVVGGTVDSPHVRMLERPVPVSPAVLAATAPVGPGEVLRVAATCVKDRCRHFADDRCALGAKIVAAVPAVEDRLPRCRSSPHVMTAVRISSSSTDEPTEARQILYWQCVGGTITVHIGHTDPAAAMSVYDGSVPTSIPCGSS
jgi:hypothetical protein